MTTGPRKARWQDNKTGHEITYPDSNAKPEIKKTIA